MNAYELLDMLKIEIDGYQLQLADNLSIINSLTTALQSEISKYDALFLENVALKQNIETLQSRITELELALTPVPPVPPPPVEEVYEIIDGGLALKDCDRNSVSTAPCFKIIGESGKTYKKYKISNSFGAYIENCSNITIDTLELNNVYGLYMKNVSNINIKRVVINDSWVGAKLITGVVNCRIDYLESNRASDKSTALTSPNGDGLLIDDSNCTGNWFGVVRCSGSDDCGLDQQGIGTVIDEYYAGPGNLHGAKLWGSTVIKKYTAEGSRGNSVLCISGDHTITNADLKAAAGEHVKMGISAYSTLKRKLTISGVADKWPNSYIVSPISNSTLIANITKV